MPDFAAAVRERLGALEGAGEALVVRELAQHLEQRYRELLASGWSPAEAERAALAELRDLDAARGELREHSRRSPRAAALTLEPARPGLAAGLLFDLRCAARLLRQRPWHAATLVLTLALGIGANVAIFSVVNALLLRPLPFPEPQQLVLLAEAEADGEGTNTSFATYADWRARSRALAQVAAFRGWTTVLTGEGEPERLQGLRVSSNYFELLGVRMQLGRGFLPQEDAPDTRRVAVLSHGLWQRRFGGDPGIVGRSVRLTGADFRVVGVLPAGFQPLVSANFYGRAEIWAPLGYTASDGFACRTCRHLRALGRLSPGASLRQAQAEMDTTMAQLVSEHPRDYASAAAPVTPLQDAFVGGLRRALALLLQAGALVLLVACANAASMLLARAIEREREIAVRFALGAPRARLLRQLFVESLLVAALGAALGLVLGRAGIEALVGAAAATLPSVHVVAIDARVAAFALALCVGTALLFGSAPAWHALRVDASSLRTSAGARRTQSRARDLLVVANAALAVVLSIGCGLTLRSFLQVTREDPGFDAQDVWTFQLAAIGARYEAPEPRRAALAQVQRAVAALPGVSAAGFASQLPLTGNYDRAALAIEGRAQPNPALAPDVERYGIGGDYLKAMRIPLLRGRAFSEDDRADAPGVAVVNEALASAFWPGGDPLGARIRLGGADDPWLTIVGVAGNVRHYQLEQPPNFQVYLPHPQWSVSYLQLAVRASAGHGIAAAVRRAVWGVDKDMPVYGATSMSEVTAASVGRRRFSLLLLGAFAVTALVLAAVGAYGVMSSSLEQRRHELGVRLAIGADRADILRLALARGLRLAVAGAAAGVAAALLLGGFVEALLHSVSPRDPLTFAVVVLLLLAVSLLACLVPARRAARLDPLAALRPE
jgi:putative ABC transport system permease protein